MNPRRIRGLAAAVLTRAIRDAFQATPSRHRQDARHFLRPGNPQLALYCELLGWDPEVFLGAVQANGRAFATRRRKAA